MGDLLSCKWWSPQVVAVFLGVGLKPSAATSQHVDSLRAPSCSGCPCPHMHRLGHVLAQHGVFGQSKTTLKNEREQKKTVSRRIFNEVKHHSPGPCERTELNPVLWKPAVGHEKFSLCHLLWKHGGILLFAPCPPRPYGLVAADCTSSKTSPGNRKAGSHLSAIDLTSLTIGDGQGLPGNDMSQILFLGRIMSKWSL